MALVVHGGAAPVNAGVTTTVRFHVLINPAAVRPGETVRLYGDLAALGGGFRGPGIAMVQSPTEPDLWHQEIELPFRLTEQKKAGLFDYRFGIRTAAGLTIVEGGSPRRPARLVPFVFCAFGTTNDGAHGRPAVGDRVRLAPGVLKTYSALRVGEIGEIVQDDNDHLPFKVQDPRGSMGWYRVADLELETPRPPPVQETVPRDDPEAPSHDSFQRYFSATMDLLGGGRCTAEGAVQRLSGLVLGFPDAERELAEVLFDEALAHASGRLPATMSLALFAMQGLFGLSSKIPRVTGRAKPDLPRPRPWCHHGIEGLNVAEIFAMDLEEVLGRAGAHYCKTGFEEAVERTAANNNFSWLRIAPLLSRVGAHPDVEAASNTQSFTKAVGSSLGLAQQQLEIAQRYHSTAGDMNAAIQDEYRKTGDFHMELSLCWARACLQYAPDMGSFGEVISHGYVVEQFARLEWAAINKVRFYSFPTGSEVSTLIQVARSHRCLDNIGIQLVAALLANHDADFFGALGLEFAMVYADKDGVGTDVALGLVDAAKGWIKRKHGDEPLTTFTAGSIWSVTPTEAEAAKDRAESMEVAVRDADALLRLKAVGGKMSNARSVIFELTRCHMFKGPPAKVLLALCRLVGQKRPTVASEFLLTSLSEKAEAFVSQIVASSLVSPSAIRDVVQMITQNTHRDSLLSQRLLFTLAATMSEPTRLEPGLTPSLASILTMEPQWSAIVAHLRSTAGGLEPLAGQSRPEKVESIAALMSAVYSRIAEVAVAIQTATINLHDLHTVLSMKSAYHQMTHILNIPATSTELLASHEARLHAFDTMLKQTQCYVTFFCSCGVNIDAENLRSLVRMLTQTYSTLELSATDGIFGSVECAEHIPWLYSLQTSELFLTTWRSTGASVIDGVRASRQGVTDPVEIAMLAVRLYHGLPGPEDLFAQPNLITNRDVVCAVAAIPDAPNVVLLDTGRVIATNIAEAADGELFGSFVVQWDRTGQTSNLTSADINATVGVQEVCERLLKAVDVARSTAALGIEKQSWIVSSVLEGGFSAADGDQGDSSFAAEDQEVVLSQAAVLSTLIPAVRTEWFALFKSVTDQSIGTADLSRQFGTIHNKQQREGEVRMLVDTGAVCKPDEPVAGPSTAEMSSQPDVAPGVLPCPVLPDLGDGLAMVQAACETDAATAQAFLDQYGSIPAAVSGFIATGGLLPESLADPALAAGDPHAAATATASTASNADQAAALAAPAPPATTDELVESVEDFFLCLRLQRWLPAILGVRHILGKLCQLSEQSDLTMEQLEGFQQSLAADWEGQTLNSLVALVHPVKGVFANYQTTQLEFFAKLHGDENLLEWLLEHDNTDSFNSLLQVCRPRTDDPRLLKAIASLVQIRTVMLEMLFPGGNSVGDAPPYRGLRELLSAVRVVDMARGSTLRHLENVQRHFSGLQELFVKETRSPGIRACHELVDFCENGTFVLTAAADKNLVMHLELRKRGDDGQPARLHTETFEYALDLRAKLMMVEIPEALLEEIPNLRALIDAFALQLQVFSGMRDALHTLHLSGHFHFQAGYVERHRFDEGGLELLQTGLERLQSTIAKWSAIQRSARGAYYFLNYYTMKEILRLVVLVESATLTGIKSYGTARAFEEAMMVAMSPTPPSGNSTRPPSSDTPATVPQAVSIDPSSMEHVCMICNTDRDTAAGFLTKFSGVEAAVSAYMDLGGILPAESTDAASPPVADTVGDEVARIRSLCETDTSTATAFLDRFGSVQAAVSSFMDTGGVLSDDVGAGSRSPSRITSAAQPSASSKVIRPGKEFKLALDFHSMLHLTSSFVGLDTAISAMMEWPSMAADAVRGADSTDATTNTESWIDEKAVLEALANVDPETILVQLGTLLNKIFWTDTAAARTREVTPPDELAKNRHDLVGVITRSDSDERSIPLWLTCAPSTNHVIDSVLSVYLRRGRLPEPGEILFCTSNTSMEEIEIIFRRWIDAKGNGRGQLLFTLADVHTLAYTKQCAVVDLLQEMLAESGPAAAANLLIVSGKKRQVILNSLSQHLLDCPPLDSKALKKATQEAFTAHVGMTQAVASTVNGAGKTRWIMGWVSDKQRTTETGGKPPRYCRLPLRESSTASSMLAVLSKLPELDDHVVHIDVGHIIPACANTMLFELLIVGVIRETNTCKVYHRRKTDVFMVEIPNSIGDKTAAALRFSALLPDVQLNVEPEAVKFHRYVFSDRQGTMIKRMQDQALVFTCKFLRALRNGVFRVGNENFNLNYQPLLTSQQIAKINEMVGFTGLDQAQAQAWLIRFDWEVMVAVNCMFDGFEAPRASAADGDITSEECYTLLLHYSGIAEDQQPNFSTLSNFVQFLYPMLKHVTEWTLINTVVNQAFVENNFKESFIRMLVASAHDFASRSVPAANQARKGGDVGDEGDDDAEEVMRTASGRTFRRVVSGQQGHHAVATAHAADYDRQQGAFDGGLPPAVPLDAENTAEAAHRFDSMISWEALDHPLAVWYVNGADGVDGVDILSSNDRFVADFLNGNLREHLRGHGVDLGRDWSKLTNQEAIQILRHAAGTVIEQPPPHLQSGYVLTLDNLTKMLSISLRLKYGLPVIVMGETGCGKSSLMRSMCAIIDWRLYTLNIHGGMIDTDIIAWVQVILERVVNAPKMNAWGQEVSHVIFLDEVNTCNCMGLFNEMLSDRSMNGQVIPANIKIVAACNPYRLRANDQDGLKTGLVYDHQDSAGGDAENVGTGIRDPLSALVYRVHPLPESMCDHVFDFGALSEKTEELYIRAMIRDSLKTYISEEGAIEGMLDNQIDEQAWRVGLEFAENMGPEQKVNALRQRMRQMMMEEAQRRAQAQAGPVQNMPPAPAPAPGGVLEPAAGFAPAAAAGVGGLGQVAPEGFGVAPAAPPAFGFGALPANPNAAPPEPPMPGLLFAHNHGLPVPPDNPFAAPNDDENESGEDSEDDEDVGDDHPQNAEMLQQQMLAQEQDARAREMAQQMMQDMGTEANDAMNYQTKSRFNEFVDTFTTLVCTAQEFVRNYHGGERSSASLRDVQRCIQVYRWFGENMLNITGAAGENFTTMDFFSVAEPARPAIRDALIMSLCYCYYFQLPRDRRALLRQALSEVWAGMQKPARYSAWGWYIPGIEHCGWLELSSQRIANIVNGVEERIVSEIIIPDGIAMNEALKENLFMILVSLMNQIPIFVIGKPGTSKSLAMELIQTNLQGKASVNAFLRSLPAVQRFSYQCSPLSTSEGIRQVFETARRYRMEAPNTVVVVLLDEVGLAELSPHLPLKIMHSALDDAQENESVVGISNWSLDPAKMNRAVHLFRPAPTVKDLALTAEGMVKTATLKGYLQAIAESFDVVYKTQQLPDFWGMREFYATVNLVNRTLDFETSLTPELMMNAILRSYGGRPGETQGIISQFFRCLNMAEVGVPIPTVVDLIQQNIVDPSSRHLMLLTENNAALSMLFDHGILKHQETTVIFGSDFPLDRTDLQVCLMLQRVKHCMAQGTGLVLVHCEALYESMYDLLNQHYTAAGGQLWVRLAFGTHSRLCPIDPNFRVIVIVDKEEAYTQLAAPLLNRFEKQVFTRADMLSQGLPLKLLNELKPFAAAFAARGQAHTATLRDLKDAICGWHSGMLCSLCSVVLHDAKARAGELGEPLEYEQLYQEAVRRLLLLATPEAVCRVLQDPVQHRTLMEDHRVDATAIYFQEQCHSDLSSFTGYSRKVGGASTPRLTLLRTYAPLQHGGGAQQLEHQGTWDSVTQITLHDLSSERDMQQYVDSFFAAAAPGSLLLIKCDPRAASSRRVSHAKYMCEKAMDDYESTLTSADRNTSAWHSVKSPPASPADNTKQVAACEEKPKDDSALGGNEATISAATKRETNIVVPAEGPIQKALEVVILVHLPRGKHEEDFVVDFDNRFNYGFIDSIMPASSQGLLNAEDMVGLGMADVLDGVDLSKVLSSNFRFAMARLCYMYERSNGDVRKQISFLLDCLKNDWFIECVRRQMRTMVTQYGLALDLNRILDGDSGLTVAGTFQQALHRQFTDALCAMFSIVLSHMDRCQTLLLSAESGLKHLWIYLFHKSFKDMAVLARRQFSMSAMQFTISVKADGRDKVPFKAQFPFSFYLSTVLESMRQTAETIGAMASADGEDGISVALQRQLDLLSFEHGLSGPLEANLLRRYCHDFACIHLINCAGFRKQDQASLLWRVLELSADSTPLQTLAQVHGRFWGACEGRMGLYCQLLDAVPASIDTIIAALVSAESAVALAERFCVPPGYNSIDFTILSILLEYLDPASAAQGWTDIGDYGRWCTQMDLARAAVVSLLSDAGVQAEESPAVRTVRVRWEKLLLIDQFLKDVAAPLQVAPAVTMELVNKLTAGDLRSSEAFRSLLSTLCLDLVALVIGKYNGDATVRRTLEKGATGVMERYFFEILFSGKEPLTDPQLLADILLVVSGKDIAGLAGATANYCNVIASEAEREALLAATMSVPEPGLKKAIVSQIHAELAASVREAGYYDTQLCQTYVSVVETDVSLVDAMGWDHKVDAPALLLGAVGSAPIQEALETLAKARRLLGAYAQQISRCVEPLDEVEADASSLEQLHRLKAAVDPLLSQGSRVDEHHLRSRRIFLLKMLEECRGVAFVRSAMQQAPIRGSPWLDEWLAKNEAGLYRFMGANKLPAHNPFTAEALFDDCDHAVAGYLGTGSLDTLGEFISAHASHQHFKTSFSLALFHEIGLLRVLPDAMAGGIGKRVSQLQRWLSSTEALSFCSTAERTFFGVCTGLIPSTVKGDPDLWGLVGLDLASTPEKIVLVRCLIHLTSKALGAVEGDQMYLFRLALLEPAKLAGTKLPTMPGDVLHMVQQALMEAGDSRGAKRWYTCPNGHPFAIGNCGMATHESRCPECGEKIGGQGHHLMPTNKVIGSVTGGDVDAMFQATVLEDKSEPGYCLRTAAEEAEKFSAVRIVSAQALRVLRLMLHGCFGVGCVLLGDDWAPQFMSVVNESYRSETVAKDPCRFVLQHFKQDHSFMQDLLGIDADGVALLLHQTLVDAEVAGGASIADAASPVPDADTGHAAEVARLEGELAEAVVELDELHAQGDAPADHIAELDAEIAAIRQEIGAVQPLSRSPARRIDRTTIPTEAGQEVILGSRHGAFRNSGDDGQGCRLAEGQVAKVVALQEVRGSMWCHVRAVQTGALWWYDARALVICGTRRFPESLATAADRDQWESEFYTGVLEGLTKGEGIVERVQQIEANFSGENDEGAAFKAELLERFDVGALSPSQHIATTGLWMRKRDFSFDHFEAAFSRDQNNAELFPVLSTFFENKAEMLSLRHLPSFFRWLDLVMERFDKNIDRNSARTVTLKDVMAKLPDVQRTSWEQAYASYETVWQLSWHRIEAFGCQEVPEIYRSQKISTDSVLAFSLPGQDDEGMCPFYLAQHLINAHNDFVQRVDQALLMRNQDVQRHSTRRSEVESNFMTSAHVLAFDTEQEFVPYVRKQCVGHSGGAGAVYDFARAEKFLIDRYFRNKPLVNLRLRGFNYADDAEIGRSLKSRVPQVPLPYGIQKRMTEELLPATAIQVLELIDTAINFLGAASFELGASVGEKTLESYLVDDLLFDRDQFDALNLVLRLGVRLKHLDGLVVLLRDLTKTDPLENVAVVYRKQLDEPTAAVLAAALGALDLPVLVPVWEQLLLRRCTSEVISMNSNLRDSLEWMEYDEATGDILGDLPWFGSFPLAVTMSHAVAAYHVAAAELAQRAAI